MISSSYPKQAKNPKHCIPQVENNHCSVLSLTAASSLTYEEAHALHHKHGRENYKGTRTITLLKAYSEAGFFVGGIHGSTRSANCMKSAKAGFSSVIPCSFLSKAKEQKGCTVGSFVKANPKGKFILLVAKHALAVVDGNIIDNCRTPMLKRVFCSFEQV